MLILHLAPVEPQTWTGEALRTITDARIQLIRRLEIALARLGGGGVDALLLDLTGYGDEPQLDWLEPLRRAAGKAPIILAVAGREPDFDGVEPVVTSVARSRLAGLISEGVTAPLLQFHPSGGAPVTAFLGVKGGVGTTTTALHVAASLAASSKTVLAEIRPDLGVLRDRLRGNHRRESIDALLELPSAQIRPSSFDALLWSPDGLPQLRILSAPVFAAKPLSFDAPHARSIVAALKECTGRVVLDLTLEAREAARAAANMADSLVLVTERTPLALRLAAEVLNQVLGWGVPRGRVSVVVVTRSVVSVPTSIENLETELGVQVRIVLPPDPDLCVMGESLRRLTTIVQPDGLSARSYDLLATGLGD